MPLDLALQPQPIERPARGEQRPPQKREAVPLRLVHPGEILPAIVRHAEELEDVEVRAADVAREVDLIEEVGRVRGYDVIPTTLPAVRPSRDEAPSQAFARRVRELQANG